MPCLDHAVLKMTTAT